MWRPLLMIEGKTCDWYHSVSSSYGKWHWVVYSFLCCSLNGTTTWRFRVPDHIKLIAHQKNVLYMTEQLWKTLWHFLKVTLQMELYKVNFHIHINFMRCLKTPRLHHCTGWGYMVPIFPLKEGFLGVCVSGFGALG